jgi:hypothetical protein
VTPGIALFKTAPDDYLVLLSEGALGGIGPPDLVQIVEVAESTDEFAQTVINLSGRRTEKDVSCVVVDIERTDEPELAELLTGKSAPEEPVDDPGAGVTAPQNDVSQPADVDIPLGPESNPAEPPKEVGELADIAGHIKRYELFQGIPAEQVDRMIAQLAELPVERGHELYTEGSPMTELYLLIRGHVMLTREGVKLGTVGPGAFLCETALLQGMVQGESAWSETPATFLTLSQMALAQLTVTDPQFAVRLYHNLARLMALRLRDKD